MSIRRAALSLALISSFTFFLGLGRPAISDSDEGFYAEAAREMVESGDWLTPHFNYEERWQKPILYYWLTAATYVVAGTSEWSARWWSALSGLGLVLLTWSAARKLTGRNDAAWLAGAITATSAGYFAMARLALPDLPLTFLLTLTIWCALEQRWKMAGLAAGFGLLMKGPLALVIPLIVLGPIWWRERSTSGEPGIGTRIDIRDVIVAAAICAAVSLPWYVAMTVAHGPAYLQSFLVGDNLERFATDRFNEPRAIWFYVPIVLGGMLPWSAYLAMPAKSVIQVARRHRRLTDTDWRLLLWALVPLLFFTISIGKQPRYILPVLPPLAILIARSVSTRIRNAGRGPALMAATLGTAALYAVMALLLYRARSLFIGTYPQLTAAAIAVIAVSAVVLAWVALSRQWRWLAGVATTCAGLLWLSVQFGALAGIRPEPVERMAMFIQANRHADEPVGTFQAFVRNLIFYTHSKQLDLFDEGLALDFLKSSERVMLVIPARDLPRLQSLAGVNVRPLAQVQYLNAAGIRLRTILSPIPDEDFETILLVTNR